MKNKYVFTVVLLLGILVISLGLTSLYVRENKRDNQTSEELLIVTSFYPMYIATDNIVQGVEGVVLKNLSEPQTGCLHDFQLTPEDMRLLAKADIFVINGGGIENFMTDVAKAYPDLQIINACENVILLESGGHEEHDHEEEAEHEHDADTEAAQEETIEHAHNHEDAGENAHAWMSIKEYRTQVATIAEKLAEADEAHASLYMDNQNRYDERLDVLQKEQEQLIKAISGQKVILFHEAFAYLADALGMETSYVLNLDEERAVSAGEVAEVLEEIQENGVSLILAEERYGSELGELVASESNVSILYLDTLNRGEYDLNRYLDGMKANFKRLLTWSQKGE